MNLSDYLTELSYKELSNLSLSDNGSGTIKSEKIPFIVSCINEALLRLYSKFVLKTGIIIIEMQEGLSEYELNSKYAYSSNISGNKYIMDGEHPFQDDIIKILDVYDTFGRSIPINNASNPLSVFTPKPNILQITDPFLYGDILSITYQAKHPLLDFKKNPSQQIELPDNLMGALSAYVAYSVYNCINTKEATEAAQKYMQTYVALVQEIIETDTINNSISQDNSRFSMNGWC